MNNDQSSKLEAKENVRRSINRASELKRQLNSYNIESNYYYGHYFYNYFSWYSWIDYYDESDQIDSGSDSSNEIMQDISAWPLDTVYCDEENACTLDLLLNGVCDRACAVAACGPVRT